ncbi:MAG: phosphoribosylformylglycinamidine cyclo-ligase [Actinobacteria bacterium]|nr:phosphoribosylformylglycinamidine cyclo-ligase [Actinomycetota bacterium]
MTSYRDAGVDLGAAERHVESIAASVTGSWGEGVIGGFGGFAAGVGIPAGYEQPVLMMSADGVGTKLELARRSGHWRDVGSDLVAMCADDLAAVGARPLGMVDYLAVGSLQPERDAVIVASISSACRAAGFPLLGGETAEHPGVMAADAVDLAGAAMGVVEKDRQLGPHRVAAGDVIIGLRSANLRSNGFSLVRSVMGDSALEHVEELLEPSVVYTPAVLSAVATGWVHSAAHVTGGGIASNLERAIGPERSVTIDKGSWAPPEVFGLVARHGVPEDEMYRVFNMGIGFCLVVEADGVGAVMSTLGDHEPMTLGEVVDGRGVELV